MSLSQQFKTDENKIQHGVRISYAANKDGTIPTFIVAPSSKANKPYSKEIERAFKPHQRAIQLKTFSNELAGQILREVFAKTVLLGWENVSNADVTADSKAEGYAEFNVANAVKLFENLPELFDDLQAQANDASLFRETDLEENAKN